MKSFLPIQVQILCFYPYLILGIRICECAIQLNNSYPWDPGLTTYFVRQFPFPCVAHNRVYVFRFQEGLNEIPSCRVLSRCLAHSKHFILDNYNSYYCYYDVILILSSSSNLGKSSQPVLDCILVSAPSQLVILNQFLNYSEPQFHHLQNGNEYTSSAVRLK